MLVTQGIGIQQAGLRPLIQENLAEGNWNYQSLTLITVLILHRRLLFI